MLRNETGKIIWWGWVNRSGNFIFVDDAKGGHEEYCTKRGLDEDKDFMDKGFVKVTQSSSGTTGISYWYTCRYPMSVEQAKWLAEHGILIKDEEIAYS